MNLYAYRLLSAAVPSIPENDAWWGKGFTEWTNVTKAHPLFRDHYQPHLPADLGFYDFVFRNRAKRRLTWRGSRRPGFCYYHYWFEGRRFLDRPFDEVLIPATGFPLLPLLGQRKLDPPLGRSEQEILMVQNYNEEDDLNHIRWLAGAFRDPRYIRVHGRPLFLVYRLFRLPDPERPVEIWRNEAGDWGSVTFLFAMWKALKRIMVWHRNTSWMPPWNLRLIIKRCLPDKRQTGWQIG